jgi:hypothetical protein
MSEGEHPWQLVDRKLAEIKIGQATDRLVDSFRKRLGDAARAAAEGGQNRISPDTVSSLIRSVDPLLKIAYRIYKEVWKLQGNKESPEFVRTLYEFMIVPRIVRHLGRVRSELGGSIDPMYPDGELSRPLLEDTEVEAEKCRREWERRCEIDALELEYKRGAESTQTDAGLESKSERALIGPQPTRPGKKPDDRVRMRREIVRKLMPSQACFRDHGKLKDLFSTLDEEGIPLPEKRRAPGGWRPKNWLGLLERPKSEETQRMLRHLRRDLFPKVKNVPKGTL